MRELLISLLLLMTVAAVYAAVAGGSDGTSVRLATFGSRMAEEIRSTDP